MSSCFLLLLIFSPICQSLIVRWCASTSAEFEKCTALNQTYINYSNSVECILGVDVLLCMDKIRLGEADVMNLDVGLGYYAAKSYSLRPFMAENYATGANTELYYHGNVIVPKTELNIDLNNLAGKQACFAGVGTAEGWLLPLHNLITNWNFPIYHCNSLVQVVAEHLGNVCAPGADNEVFNPFGDYITKSCSLCDENTAKNLYCSHEDRFAGSVGAIRCLHERRSSGDITKMPVLAFVRGGDIELFLNTTIQADYELLCSDGTRQSLNESQNCAWGGQIPSRILVTRSKDDAGPLQLVFNELVTLFGDMGSRLAEFSLFGPYAGYTNESNRNLMFHESTKQLYPMDDAAVVKWLSNVTTVIQEFGTSCPLAPVRWCVVGGAEMEKCGKMTMALNAKQIRPALNCIQGNSTINCMNLINDGFADAITLDAGELYTAGTQFNLVPIVSEYYGNQSIRHNSYFAVAIAKKTDKSLIISNMKTRKICHGGVNKATGWIIPINYFLETQQIKVYNRQLLHAYSELVATACLPGILNDQYKPQGADGLNLCDICAAGSDRRCQPDSRELYYGDGGAFRCLVEGGDVAFTKHTTIYHYTGGRKITDWARNRRSDDYQLICSDGSRAPPGDYWNCNLGMVPGATIVTSATKDCSERNQIWDLLRYSQVYFSLDDSQQFSLFHSMYGYQDLMFSDEAVALQWIDGNEQTYAAWLEEDFIRSTEAVLSVGKPGQNGMYNAGAVLSSSLTTIIMVVCIFCLYFSHF